MTKIKSFDKQNLNVVRAEIDAALKQVGDKLGIKLSIGGIRFTGDQFSTKMSAVVLDAGAEAATEETSNTKWIAGFKRYAPMYGFKASDLGRTFKYNGREYTVVGWRNKAVDKVVAKAKGANSFTALSHFVVKGCLEVATAAAASK